MCSIQRIGLDAYEEGTNNERTRSGSVTSHSSVARAFVKKKERLTGYAMYLSNWVVYSHGSHFPLACWVSEKMIFLNVDAWSNSVSTQRHMQILERELESLCGVTVVEVDCAQLKDYMRVSSIRVVKEHTPKSVEQAVVALKKQMREGASPHRVGWFIKKLREELKHFMFFEEL